MLIMAFSLLQVILSEEKNPSKVFLSKIITQIIRSPNAIWWFTVKVLFYGQLISNGKNRPEGRLSRLLFFTAELSQHTSCVIPPDITTFKANVNIIFSEGM